MPEIPPQPKVNTAWVVFNDGTLQQYPRPFGLVERKHLVDWLKTYNQPNALPVECYIRFNGVSKKIKFVKPKPLGFRELQILTSLMVDPCQLISDEFSEVKQSLIKRGLIDSVPRITSKGRDLCVKLSRIGGRKIK